MSQISITDWHVALETAITNILTGTLPDLGPDAERPKPVGFTHLPRELRDQIYRELLLPDKTQVSRSARHTTRRLQSGNSLQPAILRVSKQMHREASMVLYKETKWVLFTMAFSQTTIELFEGFYGPNLWWEGNYPWVSLHHLENFLGTPVLRVEGSDGTRSQQESNYVILVTQQDVHFLCIGIGTLPNLELTLRFNPEAMQNSHTRDVLLDCCRDIRGLRKLKIYHLHSCNAHTELFAQMTRPIKDIDEIVKRADMYKERADRQVALGHFLDAVNIHRAGFTLIEALSARDRRRNRAAGVNSESVAVLQDKIITFITEGANCLTKMRETRQARRLLGMTLQRSIHPLTNQQISNIYYHQALTFVAEKDDIQVARALARVLDLQPDHKGAKDELTALEGRLHTRLEEMRKSLDRYVRYVVKASRFYVKHNSARRGSI